MLNPDTNALDDKSNTIVIYFIILIYIEIKRTAHYRPILIRLTAPDPLKIFAGWIMLCYLKIIKTRKMNTPANSSTERVKTSDIRSSSTVQPSTFICIPPFHCEENKAPSWIFIL